MSLFRTAASTALRGIQLFLVVPLVFCGGIFFKNLFSDSTNCILEPTCRQAHQYDRWVEDYYEVFILFGITALVILGIIVAIAFLLRRLGRSWTYEDDGWGHMRTIPQATTPQRITSWLVALATVIAIYWCFTVI